MKLCKSEKSLLCGWGVVCSFSRALLFVFAFSLVTLAPDNYLKDSRTTLGNSEAYQSINISFRFCPRMMHCACQTCLVVELEPPPATKIPSCRPPSEVVPSCPLHHCGVAHSDPAVGCHFENSTWALRSHAQDNGRPNGFDWHEVCRGREKRAGGAHEKTERFVVSASSKIYPQIFEADIEIHSEPFLFIRYFFASWPCNAAEKHPTIFFG